MCQDSSRGGGRLRCVPAAGSGFAALSFWKLPWFRSGFQWRVRAFQTETVPRPGAIRKLGEGVLIRTARHIRCFSGYL